jgi:hypothetical protein
MPGARLAPAASRAKNRKHTSVVTTVTPVSPGIPRAMVLTGSFVVSSESRALLPPSPAAITANLIPASGYRDATTSPSASGAFVFRAKASTASRAQRFVTIAKRPS